MGDPLETIGLAYRAGELKAGDTAVGDAVREKTARLIITASDASERVRESARRMPERCNGLYADTHLTKAEIGKALGRAECGIVAFLETGLAFSFAQSLGGCDMEKYGALAQELSARQKRAVLRRTKKMQRAGRNQARGGNVNG